MVHAHLLALRDRIYTFIYFYLCTPARHYGVIKIFQLHLEGAVINLFTITDEDTEYEAPSNPLQL